MSDSAEILNQLFEASRDVTRTAGHFVTELEGVGLDGLSAFDRLELIAALVPAQTALASAIARIASTT